MLVCDVYGNHVVPLPAGVLGIGATSVCPGDALGNPLRRNVASTQCRARTVKQGADVAFRVNAPAGMIIAGVYIPHMWSYGIDDGSGWAGDFFWAGGSGGASVFDEETGWSSAYQGAPSFTWPASGTPYFGWQVACFQTTCTDGGTEWLSVELLELNMAETTGPTISAERRPMGHGEQLDPRQLAIGLRRRLALRRLQSQRLAERHRHPRVKLGAEPLGVSSMRRPDRATDDQHSPVRRWCPAAQTRCGRCRRRAGRHRVDRVRRQRAGQSQPQRSGRCTRDERHPVHHRNRERGTERGQRDRVLARRLAVPVLFRLEHAAGRAGGRRAPRELLCA